MHRLLISLTAALKTAIFPPRCLSCGRLFHPYGVPTDRLPATPGHTADSAAAPAFEQLMSPFLCASCTGGYLPATSPLCSMCGAVFSSRAGEDHLCGDCIRTPRPFRMARAAGIYDAPLRTVIHRLKYGGKTQMAEPLGRLMLATYLRHWERDETDLVAPVPLHISRFRQRGFNQAYLLVRRWAGHIKTLGARADDIRVIPNLLVRHRRTRPQTGLGKARRIENIKHAFALGAAADVRNLRVLLVDDVLTTGTTAAECARVLTAGGAKHVDVLTLARAA